jgi:DOPA 4,5-dioxygenase
MVKEPVDAIGDFHAHIYFDPAEMDRARVLAEAAALRFGVAVGRFHPGPIGPHPRGSCQLTVPSATFGELAPWLALNRGELTIFAHANTGDDLADHTRHVIWFGPSEALRLDVFDRPAQPTGNEGGPGLAR